MFRWDRAAERIKIALDTSGLKKMKKPHDERHCRTIYESESSNILFFASRIWLRNYLVGAGLGISVESTLIYA